MKNIFLTALSKFFFAKSSKGTSPISIVKSLTGAETLGDFFLWYLLLSAGFHPCPTPWRQRVQPGGQWEWWDGGCVLAGDKLPTNHFQVSHQQLMLSDCRCKETPLLLTQLRACSIPASVYEPPRCSSFL